MSRAVFFVITAAGAAAAGSALAMTQTGGSSLAGAGAFARSVLVEEVRGEWSAQWRTLHPAHRLLIAERQYAACSSGLPTQVPARFSILSVRRVALRVPYVPERSAALVTLRMRERSVRAAITLHVHVVRVDGRWAWILARPFIRAIDHGLCPDGEPLPSGPPE